MFAHSHRKGMRDFHTLVASESNSPISSWISSLESAFLAVLTCSSLPSLPALSCKTSRLTMLLFAQQLRHFALPHSQHQTASSPHPVNNWCPHLRSGLIGTGETQPAGLRRRRRGAARLSGPVRCHWPAAGPGQAAPYSGPSPDSSRTQFSLSNRVAELLF
eukprot:765378-Hanusia_phi.AAC.6